MFGLPAANGLFSQLRSSHIVFISSQRFFQQLTAVLRPSVPHNCTFFPPARLVRLQFTYSFTLPKWMRVKKIQKKKIKLKHPKPTRQQVRALKPQLRSLIIQLPKYAVLTESLKKSCCLFVFPHSSPLMCDAKCSDRNHIQPEPKPGLPTSSLGKFWLATWHTCSELDGGCRWVLLDLISEDITALSVAHHQKQRNLIYPSASNRKVW